MERAQCSERSERPERSKAAVRIAAMPHPPNGDHLLDVIDGIENPIVTHPHAEASGGVPDPLDPTRTGILSQCLNRGLNAYEDIPRQRLQIAPRGGRIGQAIGH
jgi:hypothetical protein